MQWRKKVKPKHTLIGKSSDETWKTSQAKEYPRRLGAAIGDAMVDAVCRTCTTPSRYSLECIRTVMAHCFPVIIDAANQFVADYVDSSFPVD